MDTLSHSLRFHSKLPKLIEIFDSAKITNHMVFLKQEENGQITSKKYHLFNRFMWQGPFGTPYRLLFYTVDRNEREKKGVVLIIDFSNPSITLCVRESSNLKKLLLDPSNIILHVEPKFSTRCIDTYSLADIVCFTYLFLSRKEKNFVTKKGMRDYMDYLDPSTFEDIETNVNRLFPQLQFSSQNPHNEALSNTTTEFI